MVNTFALFVAALAAGSVSALPIRSRDSGVDLSSLFGLAAPAAGQQSGTGLPAGFQGSNAAHDEQASQEASDATAAAAAEAAAGVDITASIAAASSSAAAAAATATTNPDDPFPTQNTNLTPEQLGQLSGLRAKLDIDNKFGDTGAAIQDQEDINALISDGEGSFGGF
ncbi:hypothetical protein B0H17DRAFT_1333482 [Mycena rosella]|uniref:Uncharacterized protein n=1 Tax=Mycena rosella TaxID=1033263 RepID=A0AAD7D776_MYCRO|nr:hypothetical protein B0H17DRAFT_1333482 [Mycena rosella]